MGSQFSAPSPPASPVKAWVTFDATSGVAVISGSSNVSSVTVNSVGRYTINFAKPLKTNTYAMIATADRPGGQYNGIVSWDDDVYRIYTTAACSILVTHDASGPISPSKCSVAFFE